MTTNMLRKNPSRFWSRLLPVLLAVLLAALLAGCGSTQAPPEETPPPQYQVRYYFGKNLLQTQTLTEGQTPAHLELALPGLTFAGWRDGSGAAAEPERAAVTGDTDYYAVTYPVLENHVPYLFPDEDGFLRPDSPMSFAALDAALHALASPKAAAYLPDFIADEEALTPDALREILLELFPAQQVDAACRGRLEGAAVTRRETAAILNSLLGRDARETVTLRRDAVRAPDCGTDDWDLLEASVSHTTDPWGEAWSGCDIPAVYAPGFASVRGRLYFIGDDGVMLTDTERDGFAFGADGVYTSGDAELDKYVVDILASLSQDHPDAEPLEMLRAAYEYARDSFTYFRKDPLAFGATGWQTEAAVEMFSTLRGNCYNYAAAFWALARGLGYDARAYSGTISEQPHGWVEIAFDGQDYLFDPELEMAARERGQMNSDRFMMTKMAAGFWGLYLR